MGPKELFVNIKLFLLQQIQLNCMNLVVSPTIWQVINFQNQKYLFQTIIKIISRPSGQKYLKN